MVESRHDVPNGLPKNLPKTHKKHTPFNPQNYIPIVIKSQQVSDAALVFLRTIKGQFASYLISRHKALIARIKKNKEIENENIVYFKEVPSDKLVKEC